MLDKLRTLYNDTKAESNVLVAIVTVVVATILIIVAAKPFTSVNGADSSSARLLRQSATQVFPQPQIPLSALH